MLPRYSCAIELDLLQIIKHGSDNWVVTWFISFASDVHEKMEFLAKFNYIMSEI